MRLRSLPRLHSQSEIDPFSPTQDMINEVETEQKINLPMQTSTDRLQVDKYTGTLAIDAADTARNLSSRNHIRSTSMIQNPYYARSQDPSLTQNQAVSISIPPESIGAPVSVYPSPSNDHMQTDNEGHLVSGKTSNFCSK